MSRDEKGANQLTLVNGDQTRVIPFYGNRLVHMEWSPDGSTLAVSVSLVSDYSGLVLRSRLYFVTWPYSMDLIENLADETIVGHAWSPDGKSLLVIKRKYKGTDYQLSFSVLDDITQEEIPVLGFQLVSEKYLLLQPVFWIP
jgi:Tol biopolymer transport system component